MKLVSPEGLEYSLPSSQATIHKFFKKTEVLHVQDKVIVMDGQALEKALGLNIFATEQFDTPVFGPALVLSSSDYLSLCN